MMLKLIKRGISACRTNTRRRTSNSVVYQNGEETFPLESRLLLTPSPFDSSPFDGTWKMNVVGSPNPAYTVFIDRFGQSTADLPQGVANLNNVKTHRNILKANVQSNSIEGKLKIVGNNVDQFQFWSTFSGSVKLKLPTHGKINIEAVRTAYPPG